jgi:gliding motility-associated-like protein
LAQFPAKILANDTTLCEGDTLILTPNVNNASYLWQDNTSTPTFEVVSSGQYSVIASIGPCTSEDLINVGFFPTPDLSVITDTIFCLGETLEIDLTNTGTNYLWSDNTTSPTFAITQSGDYFVTVSNQGCAATKNFSVEIDPCGKSLLNIPNVFSPNGDGINDKFEFEIAGYKTLSGIILNRWGKVIYQWEGFESYWDGGESPAGVYFYIVNAVDFNEKSEEQKGTITLIR